MPSEKPQTTFLPKSFMRASIVLIITCVVLFVFQNQSLTLFEFNRTNITNGEFWRLFTANFMHTNHWHLILNLAGLIMLTHLFGRLMSNLHFIMFSVANGILVSVSVYYFSLDIELYVGLSGYLHGLFVYGCLIEIYQGMKNSWFLLLGISIKISYETFYGATNQMSELINASVATDAHLFGALIAVVQFGLLAIYSRLQKSKH